MIPDLQSGYTRIARRLRVVGLSSLCFVVAHLYAGKLRLADCPVAVRETIVRNLMGGKLDEIKEIKINDHALYLVEIDLKGFRDAKLHISGDGTLRKALVEIKLRDLPAPVLREVEELVKRRAQIEDVDMEIIQGKTLYRVKIDPPKGPDKVYYFEEDGSIATNK